MNVDDRCLWLLVFAIVVLSTGCEPKTREYSYAVPDESELVADPSSSRHCRWPVVEGTWKMSRPTDVAFLRELKKGELQRIAESQLEQDAQRMKAVQTGDEIAPWLIASTGLKGETAAQARRVIGEFENQLVRRDRVEIPDAIEKPTVWIDNTARHMLISGQNGLWISEMPWRPTWAWASPDGAETKNASWEFKRIPLTSNEPGDKMLGFCGVKPDGSDSRCIVAHKNHVHLVDCNHSMVIASFAHQQEIRHVSVAKETGHVAVVDAGGNLFWSDPQLSHFMRVDELDLSLPMPAIAPDASRIITWRSKNQGGIYTIADGKIQDDFSVPVKNEGDPLMTWCSKKDDFWIEKDRIFKLTADEKKGYRAYSSDRIVCYWDIVELTSLYRDSDQDTQLIIADRPTEDGGTQRVMYDARLGDRKFFAPHALGDLGDRRLSVATTGAVVVFYDSGSIEVYDRIVDAPQDTRSLYSLGRHWSWTNQFEGLEALHDAIRKLPEKRFGATKEQLYFCLVDGIATEFCDVERAVRARTLPAERLAAIEERFQGYQRWIKTASPLVSATELRRQSKILFEATSNAWRPASAFRFNNATEAGQKGMAAWQRLSQSEDIPAHAYGHYLALSRGLRVDIKDAKIEETMQQYVARYPHEPYLHGQASHWRTKLNDLQEGVGPAYAEAVSKAVGPPMGDYIYFRCAFWIHHDFPIANIDGDRVQAGLEFAMDMSWLDAIDTMEVMSMIDRSYSYTGDLRSAYARRSQSTLGALGTYYRQRFPLRANAKCTERMLDVLP